MATNPVKKQEKLNSPLERSNPLNDPKFSNQQGYNVFDLNNEHILTPRFGEYTPMFVCETVPGDRHYLYSNTSSVVEQIDANLMTVVNEYHDHIYVPLRCIYPNNYEKLIPNPTKGDDLPWEAEPMIPLLKFLNGFLRGYDVNLVTPDGVVTFPQIFLTSGGVNGNLISNIVADAFQGDSASARAELNLMLNSLAYTGLVLSRGQLLDYIGYCPENQDLTITDYIKLERDINDFFDVLSRATGIQSFKINPEVRNVEIDIEDLNWLNIDYTPEISTKSDLRRAFYDAIEAGDFINFIFDIAIDDTDVQTIIRVYDTLLSFTSRFLPLPDMTDPYADGSYINPSRLAAYQMSVAEYASNDHIDNIFTAQLWMQNLRSIMFPATNGLSSEPIFDYNGVETEYDLLTTGAFESFMSSNLPNKFGRAILIINQLFLLRRSLRYGDYYSTARPNLVAVGQLGIPVNNGMVNPVDNIRGLVMQRFVNAVNWVGSKIINYFGAIFGVKPSNTGPRPVYIAHRKIELQRDKTVNTADNQGHITTNLNGYTDNKALDVFIDDFGVIIGFVSYDALPIYNAGIDRGLSLSDRFEYFNPMLQNVGDQEITLKELLGWTGFAKVPFGYTARYAQYKIATSRAHGAAVNLIKGVYMKYPPLAMFSDGPLDSSDFKINPNFIRDKPAYFDQFFEQRTGFGPGSYYHFVTNVTNVHNAARKMMYQPPVL